MQARFRLIRILFVLSFFLAGCSAPAADSPAGQACRDPGQAAEAFYAANDRGDTNFSLGLLDDDAALITWAEGANGYHMKASFAVGKDQIAQRLGEPGLKRLVAGPDLPNFKVENQMVEGNIVRFELMPDRVRENGRPYNHYSVELVFKSCRIELLKVVERVTWL